MKNPNDYDIKPKKSRQLDSIKGFVHRKYDSKLIDESFKEASFANALAL